MRTKRFVIGMIVVVMALTMVLGTAWATKDDTGRGGPSGPHYTLNILGKDWEHEEGETINCDDGSQQGHRIFVRLGQAVDEKKGKIKISVPTDIMLTPGPFQVIDCDGTDGEATFQLPDPEPTDPAKQGSCTAYSVWVRTLGKPGGSADMRLCATYTDPCDGEIEYCGEGTDVVELPRAKGKVQKFANVSIELLTICVWVYVGDDAEGDPIYEWQRLYLFDPLLEGQLWKYNNAGLRHAQIRFYLEEDCSRAGDFNCDHLPTP
jgi:hypothetical protein